MTALIAFVDKIIINERIDCMVRWNMVTIQTLTFHKLPELNVDPIKFIAEFKRQYNWYSVAMATNFIKFGFQYNEALNKRLGRPEGYPTWKEFIEDCYSEVLVKYAKDIDRKLADPTWR